MKKRRGRVYMYQENEVGGEGNSVISGNECTT
jgi:hypothetical protein